MIVDVFDVVFKFGQGSHNGSNRAYDGRRAYSQTTSWRRTPGAYGPFPDHRLGFPVGTFFN